MILFANFLYAVARIIHFILMLYMWIIIFRAILSWVKVPSLYALTVVLHNLTEPVLKPFRKLVPPKTFGGIDITPIIVILLIYFVDAFLVKSISDIARQMVSESRFSF